MLNKVILAYSGGLDTSVAIQWLREKYNLDIIALTVNLGNMSDLESIRQKALDIGAIKAIAIDATSSFIESYVFPALQANAIYEDEYPLACALGRPLIAQLMVKAAHDEGAAIVAHGCTGKGNDQVRLDVSISALDPKLKIVTPAREWNMTREQTIAYAQTHGIPVPITKSSPYSIDENLWGRAIECGVLENPWSEPPRDVFAWTKPIEETPDIANYVEINFSRGIPTGLNGKEMNPVKLVQTLHETAGQHGIGRIDHIENRIVGIKSREIYEAPAAIVLVTAHRALEQLVLSKEQLCFKSMVANEYAELIYNGLWFTGIRQNLAAFVTSSQEYVSGTVKIKLFKGNCQVVGRKSPYSLYDYNLATYDEGDTFTPSDATGFIHIWSLPVKTQAQAQMPPHERR
ncbi:MAG: argininosuccinate synthase [Dehalococcoidia bacterium]|nr:argininosuccinate synthase [Dehalococcoidia bacterium]